MQFVALRIAENSLIMQRHALLQYPVEIDTHYKKPHLIILNDNKLLILNKLLNTQNKTTYSVLNIRRVKGNWQQVKLPGNKLNNS